MQKPIHMLQAINVNEEMHGTQMWCVVQLKYNIHIV